MISEWKVFNMYWLARPLFASWVQALPWSAESFRWCYPPVCEPPPSAVHSGSSPLAPCVSEWPPSCSGLSSACKERNQNTQTVREHLRNLNGGNAKVYIHTNQSLYEKQFDLQVILITKRINIIYCLSRGIFSLLPLSRCCRMTKKRGMTLNNIQKQKKTYLQMVGRFHLQQTGNIFCIC